MSEPRRGRATIAAIAGALIGLAAGGGVAWQLQPDPPDPIRVSVPEIREVPVVVPADCPEVDCPDPEPPQCVTVGVEWGGLEHHDVCRDRRTWIADAVALRLED